MGPEPRSLDAKARPPYVLQRDGRVMEGIGRGDSHPPLGIMTSLARVRLVAIPWIVAHQAPLSMEFSRQEYWSG